MKKIIALVMSLMLLIGALPAAAMSNSAYFCDSTPVYNASSAQFNNIQLAAWALDGWYVPYGAQFSFNDAVGPRTKENGYMTAVNGRGSKVRGGGVAQVATTLYLALLQIPGIQFDEISTYGSRFTGSYVSDGSLAIVTDYEAGTDFAFTNYYGDMFIYAWIDGGYLYCEIESADNGGYNGGYTGTSFVGCAAFRVSGTTGLVNNITRAANSIDGCTFLSGETFSFNDTVGPRTEAYGYVSAVNGRGVKVVGGGVAQVASVIWLAVKDLDCITITEKSTYGSRYNQDYVASSDDAIVTDYNAGTDFAFRYTGSGTLIINVYVLDGTLWCDIYEEFGTGNTGSGTGFGGLSG